MLSSGYINWDLRLLNLELLVLRDILGSRCPASLSLNPWADLVKELLLPLQEVICVCSTLRFELRCLKHYCSKVRPGQPGGKSFR